MFRRIMWLLLFTMPCLGCFYEYEGSRGVMTGDAKQYYRNIDGSYPDVGSYEQR